MGLFIHEEYINQSKGHGIGSSGDDPYESFTADPGELYRFLRKEYGRCTGAVYVDPAGGGPPRRIGWVFLGRDTYQDAPRYDRERHGSRRAWREQWTYLREVWATVHEAPPTRTVEYHYKDLGAVCVAAQL